MVKLKSHNLYHECGLSFQIHTSELTLFQQKKFVIKIIHTSEQVITSQRVLPLTKLLQSKHQYTNFISAIHVLQKYESVWLVNNLQQFVLSKKKKKNGWLFQKYYYILCFIFWSMFCTKTYMSFRRQFLRCTYTTLPLYVVSLHITSTTVHRVHISSTSMIALWCDRKLVWNKTLIWARITVFPSV